MTANTSSGMASNPGAQANDPAAATSSMSNLSKLPQAAETRSTSDLPVYSAGAAFKDIQKMVKEMDQCLSALFHGGDRGGRRAQWRKDVECLNGGALPQTMIAFVGATGSGKSSIINALLDCKLVPTSGLSACTAVITEISYHPEPTIEADVHFITESQWRDEIMDLIDEVSGHEPNSKTDSTQNGSVAWAKVHALYPSLKLQELSKLSADDILERNRELRSLLGTSKRVSAASPEIFTADISRYVGAMSQGRGQRPGSTRNTKGRGVSSSGMAAGDSSRIDDFLKDWHLEGIQAKASVAKSSVKSEAPHGRRDGTLWPLVSKVSIRCNAPVLASGAIFVDLPGIMDDNAARNSIAKDYMGRCQKVWIVAPIKRAVDDRMAKTLLNEHIRRQLKMDKRYSSDVITFIATHSDDISCMEVVNQLGLREDRIFQELEHRLGVCERDIRSFRRAGDLTKNARSVITSRLQTSKERLVKLNGKLDALQSADEDEDDETCVQRVGIKRQQIPTVKTPSARKKRRSRESDGNETVVSLSDNGFESESNDNAALVGRITEIEKLIEDDIFALDSQIPPLEAQNAQALLASLDKESAAQLAINTYCSQKRSEYSRAELQEDFRKGQVECQKSPSSDTAKSMAVSDLPIFCCSSRDYVRLTDQMARDGKPSCFAHADETEIPALRSWALNLTRTQQDKDAGVKLSLLKLFVRDVRDYVVALNKGVNPGHAALKLEWESVDETSDDNKSRTIRGPVGINRGLAQEFGAVAAQSIAELKAIFRNDLEGVCMTSAKLAASQALEFTDKTAASMHWRTYRATLRRHGSHDFDINVGMSEPFVKGIELAWSETFEKDVFASLEGNILLVARKFLQNVAKSASPDLHDEVAKRIKRSVDNLANRLTAVIETARRTLESRQREITRKIVPHVQKELKEGYLLALMHTGQGRGSAKQEKGAFSGFVKNRKDGIFNRAARMVVNSLMSCADEIGAKLTADVQELARKVELDMAVLWAGVQEDRSRLSARASALLTAQAVLHQVKEWKEAKLLAAATAAITPNALSASGLVEMDTN